MKNKRELPHSNISENIIGCCFEVMKELGSGVYTNEFKIWEFGKVGATDLEQRSGAEAAQL